MVEILIYGIKLFEQAAECDDPYKRMVLAWAGQLVCMNSSKKRKRKPFNPMLGETFEYVGENFRIVSEKI
jgi:hypothetical protein